jgi:hypothetical protein
MITKEEAKNIKNGDILIISQHTIKDCEEINVIEYSNIIRLETKKDNGKSVYSIPLNGIIRIDPQQTTPNLEQIANRINELTQPTTPQDVEEELSKLEKYICKESGWVNFEIRNTQFYSFIKSALASSVSEIDTNKLNFYKQQLYEVNKKAFEDALEPHTPNLEQLKNEIIEDAKGTLINDYTPIVKLSLYVKENKYCMFIAYDDDNCEHVIAQYIFNQGVVIQDIIDKELAHKITTYFTMLEDIAKEESNAR